MIPYCNKCKKLMVLSSNENYYFCRCGINNPSKEKEMEIDYDVKVEFEKGEPLLAYYEAHADLGGMPCLYQGGGLFKRCDAKGEVQHVPVHVLEVSDGSTLYIPQHLVWFGRLPDMDTYEKIKKDKMDNEELARIARKGQLEQMRQAMAMAESGIVGGRMVPQ